MLNIIIHHFIKSKNKGYPGPKNANFIVFVCKDGLILSYKIIK